MNDTALTPEQLEALTAKNEAKRVADEAAQEALNERDSAAQKAILAANLKEIEDGKLLFDEQRCFASAGLMAPFTLEEAYQRRNELP